MNRYVIFDKGTRAVVSVRVTNVEPDDLPVSHGWIEVPFDTSFSPKTHKVVGRGKPRLVAMSDAEQARMDAPTMDEVKALIAGCLAQSDRTQVPDFPISDAAREAWREWRQALRDLSKNHATAADMIRAFPVDPNGENHASHLVERL